MDDVRSVRFQGEAFRFWMAPTDPIVRLPALHAEWSLGGLTVEDPASRTRIEDYSDHDLIELVRSRSRFSTSIERPATRRERRPRAPDLETPPPAEAAAEVQPAAQPERSPSEAAA